MTTTRTITTRQITSLRQEAGSAGDPKMVVICDRALRGSRAARAECARVIAAAEAMCTDDE